MHTLDETTKAEHCVLNIIIVVIVYHRAVDRATVLPRHFLGTGYNPGQVVTPNTR